MFTLLLSGTGAIGAEAEVGTGEATTEGRGLRRDIETTGTGGDPRLGETTTGGRHQGGMTTMMSGEEVTMEAGAGAEDEVGSVEVVEVEVITTSNLMMTTVAVMDHPQGGKTRRTGSQIILNIFSQKTIL